jgi:hypothetical protein
MMTEAGRIEDHEGLAPSPKADVGLIVVHGIGRQKRDETAKRLAEKLADAPPAPISLASGQGFRVQIESVSVIVREATWAHRSDLTNPPRVRDSRAVLKQLVQTLVEMGKRLATDVSQPWKGVLGTLLVITLASHLLLSGWTLFSAWSADSEAIPNTRVDAATLLFGVLSALGPFGLTLFAVVSKFKCVALRVIGVVASPLLALFVYLAVYVFFSLPLFYLSLFTLIAVIINLLAKFVVNPPLRWVGEVLQRPPKALKWVASSYNILVNAMLVIPVHALLQATKAYVNLFSVFVLGRGDGGYEEITEEVKSPKWTRPQAILWSLVVTAAFLGLLFLSEILTYLIWLPLVLGEFFRFFSSEWWLMCGFVAVFVAIVYVPLGLLLDVSNYQVAAPEERQSIFDDVIDDAVADLAGCTELHIVAHSLGSALAYDWLWKDEESGEDHPPVTALHTAGSPLNKFWFLDHTISERSRDCKPVPAIAEGRWKNYWSWMDPISGKLRRYPNANDIRIARPGGFLVSHIKYWEKEEVRESVRLLVKESPLQSQTLRGMNPLARARELDLPMASGGAKMSTGEHAFKLDSGLLATVERVYARHRAFARRARDRAQQMLFFFGLCRTTPDPSANDAIGRYRAWCRRKLGDLSREVMDYDSLVKEVDELLDDLVARLSPAPQIDWRSWLQQPSGFESWREDAIRRASEHGFRWNKNWRSAHSDLLELWRCRQELERWKPMIQIQTQLDPDASTAGDESWTTMRKIVEEFLAFEGVTATFHRLMGTKFGRPARLWSLVQLLRNLPGWGQKHLSLLLALVLGLYVVLRVEAINSLIQNMGYRAAIPFGLTLLPLLLTQGWVWLRLRRSENVPAWDLGGVPHRSWRHLARAPGRLFERWPVVAAEAGSGAVDIRAFYRDSHSALQNLRKRRTKPESILDVIVGGQVYRLLWYLIAWIVGSLLLSWLVAAGWVDSTYLTVFLVVVILYSMILAGRLIDFWDFLEPKPIRLHWLTYAAVGLFALLEGWGYPFFIVAFLGWAVWFLWTFSRRPGRPLRLVLAIFSAIMAVLLVLAWSTGEEAEWIKAESQVPWRADIEWPFPDDDDGPLVVMAASGGGSRAALYTALTLKKLEETKVLCPELSKKCVLSDYLQAISSVSGGSLANAGYVARRLAGYANDKKLKVNLEDAVAEDFILSTILGALNPRLSRGDSIERNWQGLGLDDPVRRCQVRKPEEGSHWGVEGMALGDICLSDLARVWRDAAQADAPEIPFPMPLFNTSTLDGHDLVISPLAKELYTSPGVASQSRSRYQASNATWVYFRDAIYGIEDLLGGEHDVLLSSAVRASANFPFGFPLIRLKTEQPLYLRPDWNKLCPNAEAPCGKTVTVHLTDGGALSNSGMWPMFRLLINRADELRERGVLLILVDASKMPELGVQEKALLNLRATIGDQAPIGQYLHRTMLDLLEQIYGDGIAVTQIDLEPTRESNIHTTWAFDPGTRKRLTTIFTNRWKQKSHSLTEKWNHLRDWAMHRRSESSAPAVAIELIDRDRPPLD